MTAQPSANDSPQFDYIIVGSGAGGGPLAARLAQAGKRVLVLDAGSNHGLQPATDPAHEVSLVPSLHGVSTEHRDLSWRFFVKHYDNPADVDPKVHVPANGQAAQRGIFYPRAAALGGCTVHNAMITIVGPDSDWDDLADFLADDSWRASRMRSYFKRMEANEYSPRPTPPPRTKLGRGWENFLWLLGFEPDHTSGRHGFNGWLHTSVTDISLGLHDKQLVKMLKAALRQANRAGLERSWTLVRHFFKGRIFQSLDPNHARTQRESPEGLVLIPLAVCGKRTTIHQDRSMPFVMRGRRSSPRELLLQTQASHPENLTIWTDCLVTKVLLDNGNPPRAYGVEFMRGKGIYRAHFEPNAPPESREQVVVRAGGEVILCGGAFNTPQLLMLSGIGDTTHLNEHGIECRVHLPGVGLNLQDRYEVTVISHMKRDFSLLNRATFALPDNPADADPHLREWREEGTGLYTSNGAVLGIFKRSRPDLVQPDLFIFGIPLPFEGYKIGYSDVGDQHDRFTWAILKGQTRNHDGTVRLRSSDPLDTPDINFHYFNEVSRPDGGTDDPDLLALLDGVKFVRGIADHARWWIKSESHPGDEFSSATDDAIKQWIRQLAWGHHACGTCRMGPDGDLNAVLDSRFRVRNVAGLRVVDASVFPRIPGYFIVANIYLASEKAADVILEDSSGTSHDSPIYPRELREREVDAIQQRRAKVTSQQTQASSQVPSPVFDSQTWSADVTGLGLSGGGIRSATFNLGVLQSLASAKCLRKFDFLSTVSGGGYIGSFLGRFFDRLRGIPLGGAGSGPTLTGPEVVEQELTNPSSRVIEWLRKHGNYIAPSGQGDVRVNLATFLRNLLSVHFVVGTLLLAVFGLANAIRYGLFDKLLAGYGLVASKGDMPLGHLIEASLGPFFSPWFVLFELIVLFVVVPRMVGYWIVSQDQHERYQLPPLLVLFLVATVLLGVSIKAGLALEPLLIALSLLSSFIHVEMTWRGVRLRERATGSGGVETQRLRSRNYLTYDLGLALALAGVALAFALVDTVGHGLQQWLVESNTTYAEAFAAIAAAVVALMPIARMAANLFAGDRRRGGPPSTISRMFKEQVVAGLLALALLSIPLIGYSFAAHAVYQGGAAVWIGIGTTALAIVISLILIHPKAVSFVNRSSLAQAYGARLARAYLGASNSLRHRPDGANVTEVMASDDVASIRDYRPHESGGPLHLINVIVNQTVDFDSQRGNRDRKGENVAVTPIAMSIGKAWHSAWADHSSEDVRSPRKRPCGMVPLGHVPGSEHPLIDEVGRPAKGVEMLSLRQWVAISGAAVGPGRGQTTELGTALLFGLANLRTGHWWNSGITEAARDGFPNLSFMRRLLYLLPKVFVTQFLLLFEWVAYYPGPWEQYWNISDGGFFENLGGYELIRRRIPRILISDASADPTYQLEGLANLVRKARIDFSAEIVPFTAAELNQHVPAPLRSFVGTLDNLKPQIDTSGNIIAPSTAHAALFWVHYAGQQQKSVLLYLKALMTGDESADVRHYQATHPEFPHEATADQFFDEGQWESYRRIGEHVSAPLFSDPTWFWAIPVR